MDNLQKTVDNSYKFLTLTPYLCKYVFILNTNANNIYCGFPALLLQLAKRENLSHLPRKVKRTYTLYTRLLDFVCVILYNQNKLVSFALGREGLPFWEKGNSCKII